MTSNRTYRFLVNTPHAIRCRRFRAKCKAKGKCTRCPKQAKDGFTMCQDCLDYGRQRQRDWRTK